MKIMDKLGVELNRGLLFIYQDSDKYNLSQPYKDNLLLITQAYQATYDYVKYHYEDFFLIKPTDEQIHTQANTIFSKAMENLMLSYRYIRYSDITSNIIYNNYIPTEREIKTIRSIIYREIDKQFVNESRPSIMTFAEIGMFTNIEITPKNEEDD